MSGVGVLLGLLIWQVRDGDFQFAGQFETALVVIADLHPAADSRALDLGFLPRAACRAEWKQAANPEAKSCSGLVPSLEPPNSR